MATKAILAILAVNLILLQVTFAKPAASSHDHFKSLNVCKLKDTYNALAPSERDHILKPSLQLMMKMFYDLQDLALSYVTKAKELTDQILKEPVVESDSSSEMKKFKEELEDFEKQYNACDDIEKLFHLMDIFSHAAVDYYEGKGEEKKVILEVLKKYQVKEMDDEFKRKFLEDMLTDLGRKIDELSNKLKVENQEMSEKILKWWEDVKSLKNEQEKSKKDV